MSLGLPWTTEYSQSKYPYAGGNPLELESNESFVHKWLMAISIIFTLAVFLFENMLDRRQAKAYLKTDFPSQLETAVSRIDEERKQKIKANKDIKQEEKIKNQEDIDINKKSSLEKLKPILPQLKKKYEKSQNYGTDKIKFSMFSGTFDIILSIFSILIGDAAIFWDVSRYFIELMTGSADELENEIKISMVFVLLFSIFFAMVSLPFELYSNFQIEKKHGFNKITYNLFLSDKLKSFLLSNAIGLPLAAMMLKIIKWGGDYFYIYIWIFMFMFSVSKMTLIPVFIMPIIKEYEQLKDGDLEEKIYELAGELNFPLTNIFVMDGSKRSSHSNAFMFGFGRNKRIVLYDTLINQVEDEEIVAILAHELGHWALGHTWSSFFIAQIYTGVAFYCFSFCYHRSDMYEVFGFDDPKRPVPTIIVLSLFFMVIWAPVDKTLSFMMNIRSRQNDFAADKFSFTLGMGEKLQTGLCKISLENLGAMSPDPWYATYHYTHPPLVERLSVV